MKDIKELMKKLHVLHELLGDLSLSGKGLTTHPYRVLRD